MSSLKEAPPIPHEFVPFRITKDDKPDHVCSGHCVCGSCGHLKMEREYHYQTRDARRPKETP